MYPKRVERCVVNDRVHVVGPKNCMQVRVLACSQSVNLKFFSLRSVSYGTEELRRAVGGGGEGGGGEGLWLATVSGGGGGGGGGGVLAV